MKAPDSRQELLQALLSRPGFGLELVERVRERTGGRLVLASGRIYPLLREMERDGLVVSFEGETVPERGGRPRIYYELTGQGRRVAHEAVEKGEGWLGAVVPNWG